MIQAITLLKTALALLTLVATSPVALPQSVKDNAILISNQAIVVALEELAKSPQTQQNEPIYTPPVQNQPNVVTPSQPTPTGSVPSETITIQTTKMITLEIINPMAGKGLGRTYEASPEIVDEKNYIEIGILCRDNGVVVNDQVVTVEATDETQNKTLNGTGDIYTTYVNNQKTKYYYYPYHYEFKTSGDHTITFTCQGVSEQVTLSVTD